jgi:hypothetical protein
LTHRIARIVISCLIPVLPAASQDAASQIKAETQRLQQSLKDKPISDPDFHDLNSMAEGALKSAAEALSAGWLYLSLERLNQASDLLQGARFAADKKAATIKGGLPAFESEWGKASLSLSALDQETRKRNWNDAPAVLRALAEAAQGKTLPLLDGGRGFATSTAPKDGLFYLGQAQGEAEFAKLCSSVSFPRKGGPALRRSLLRELQNLQAKTNAAFVPPRSIELHPRFIALNSTINLARELDAARSYSGALYQYLEAVRHYGMLDAPPVDAARQAELKTSVDVLLKKLSASERDDSIAQLFAERAASQVSPPGGSTPTADEWRSAQVIIDQVMPAYFATLKPVSPLQQASSKTVDITLVRWPYT